MKKNLILIILFFYVYNVYCVKLGGILILEDDTSIISNYDMVKNDFKFDLCKNVDKADFNLLVKISDLFTFQPFFKIYDLIWSVDRAGKGKFSEINIMPGIGFNFKYKEKVTCLIWLANLNKFLELSGFWNGLNIGAQVNVQLEKQYLTLMFKDDFIPLFLYDYNSTHLFDLIDIFSCLITYNCFNYVDKKANSGIYFQEKLEIEVSYFNTNYLSTRFTSTLYTGFCFNPHKIFKCYIAYAMLNTQIINNNSDLTVNKWNIGFRTGLYFFPKWFVIHIYYMPFFYNYNNEHIFKMTHTIGAALTFTLK